MKRDKIKLPSRRVDHVCLVCGRTIHVIVYQDGTYRGGHYFGTLTVPPIKPKRKSTTLEYWECPTCNRD